MVGSPHAPTGVRAGSRGGADRGPVTRYDHSGLGPRARRLVANAHRLPGGVAIDVINTGGLVAFYHACPGYPDGRCHCFHPYALIDGRFFPCSADTCPNPHYQANVEAFFDPRLGGIPDPRPDEPADPRPDAGANRHPVDLCRP